MINLEPNQMEWMWQHLGHTGDVHKTHYRQMSGFIERVQLTKLFLLQDMNLTNKYKGQKLDDIDVRGIQNVNYYIFLLKMCFPSKMVRS